MMKTIFCRDRRHRCMHKQVSEGRWEVGKTLECSSSSMSVLLGSVSELQYFGCCKFILLRLLRLRAEKMLRAISSPEKIFQFPPTCQIIGQSHPVLAYIIFWDSKLLLGWDSRLYWALRLNKDVSLWHICDKKKCQGGRFTVSQRTCRGAQKGMAVRQKH